MSMIRRQSMLLTVLFFGIVRGTAGQVPPDPKTAIHVQRDAMARFANMDGMWRGEAWVALSSGERHELTQTERVGSTFDGSVKVIEGRGYEADGTVGFVALGIISYDLKTQTYSMRSYAQGQAGDFAISPTTNGFTWEIPAGPVTMKYSAVIKDDKWHEVGDRIMPGKDSVRFFEMTLKRIGDTDWPAGGAIPPN